tara:strand:- start:28 stop:246 length:219 start_codon:yes stop_codon:yes gene_type:complete
MTRIERVYIKNINVDEGHLHDSLVAILGDDFVLNWSTYTFQDVVLSDYHKLLDLKNEFESEGNFVMISTGGL